MMVIYILILQYYLVECNNSRSWRNYVFQQSGDQSG
jgi:hypothetical protein